MSGSHISGQVNRLTSAPCPTPPIQLWGVGGGGELYIASSWTPFHSQMKDTDWSPTVMAGEVLEGSSRPGAAL